MKKIMIFTNSLTGGGAERVATNLASQLSNYYDIILVVINGENDTYGSTVETIDLKMKKKGKFNFFWYYHLYKKVKKIKRKYGITDCVSFLPPTDLVNVLTKKHSKAIVSVRNKVSSESTNIIFRVKNRIVFNSADGIVSISKMVKEDLMNNFGVSENNIHVIYNPCDKDKIQSLVKEDLFTAEERHIFNDCDDVVITAGRLTKQKGQWHLIRAFSRVVRSNQSAKLVILGVGEKESYLRRLIKDYGLESNIFLLGFKANPYPYLKKSSLFVFSSLFEGLGNILLEAMACELPIISTDCNAGPRELLAPNTNIKNFTRNIEEAEYGILVPNFDGHEYDANVALTTEEIMMADSILLLMKNKKLKEYYKNKSSERGEHFGVDQITEQWIDMIEL